jgi:hypothetical protein
VIEIDESLFVKVKHHKGKDLSRSQVWVFGFYERDDTRSNKRCLFVVVPKRDAYTLLNLIYHYCLENSIIHSDCWAAYNRIKQLDKRFEHYQVNHDLYFVDPQTRVHTNSIESMWRQVKCGIDKNKGVNRDYLQSYLDEFCWRHNNQVGRTGACEKLLDLVGAKYPGGSINDEDDELENKFKFLKINYQHKQDSQEVEELDLDIDDNEIDATELVLPDYEEANAPKLDELSEAIAITQTDDKQFEKSIAQKLGVLLASDDEKIEFNNLNISERALVHRIAEKMGLKHTSRGEENNRILYVHKQGAIIDTPTKRKVVRETLKKVANSPIPKATRVDEVLSNQQQQPKKRGRKPKQQEEPQIQQQEYKDSPPQRYLLRTRRK